MKKIVTAILTFMLGIMVSFVMNIAAETMLSSEQVSYSNSKTSETTVKGNLDELFSAVDINERLGDTPITGIGNGTVTGAISTLNTNVDSINSSVSSLNSNITTLNNSMNSTVNALGNVSFLPFNVSGSSSRTIPKNGTEVWIFIVRANVSIGNIIMIDTWNQIAKNAVNDMVDVVVNSDGTITLTNNYAGMVRCLAIYSSP